MQHPDDGRESDQKAGQTATLSAMWWSTLSVIVIAVASLSAAVAVVAQAADLSSLALFVSCCWVWAYALWWSLPAGETFAVGRRFADRLSSRDDSDSKVIWWIRLTIVILTVASLGAAATLASRAAGMTALVVFVMVCWVFACAVAHRERRKNTPHNRSE